MNSKISCQDNCNLPKRKINAESEDRYFSFYELKEKIGAMDNFNEKIILVTEEQFEYQQADIISVNAKLPEYDLQCRLLIDQLHKLKELKEVQSNTKRGEMTEANLQRKKMKINGPLNIVTNAFKQMMTTIKNEGTPYLPYKIKDIAQLICDNFTDENGNPLSPHTILTYLSPSRNDKDPNNDRSVKL